MNLQRLVKHKPLLLLAAALFLAAVTAGAWLRFGRNASSFLFIGAQGHCPDVYFEGLSVRDDVGYDGQFYYYVALDPFVRRPSLYECTRTLPYRYQRFLYPLAAHVLGGGSPRAIPYAMIGLNLASILLGTFLLMKFCDHAQVPPALALFYPLSFGPFVSLMRSTVEPFYIGLLLTALYFFFVRNRVGWAVAFFVLAAWTKELALVPVALLVLRAAWRREFKTACLLAIPFLFFFAWQWHVKNVFASFSFNVEHMKQSSILRSVKSFADYYLSSFTSLGASPAGWVDAILLTAFVSGWALLIAELALAPNFFAWVGAAFGALVLSFSFPPRGTDFWGYGRHTIEIFLCLFFCHLSSRSRRLWVPIALNGLAFAAFLLGSL